MGYMRLHTIVVTGSYHLGQGFPHWAEHAHQEACRIFADTEAKISDVSEQVVNGHRSFAIFPDGSKEGWDTSDAGDDAREEFVAWLRDQAYEDGSSPLSWVEVQYGDDEGDTRVLACSDEQRGR